MNMFRKYLGTYRFFFPSHLSLLLTALIATLLLSYVAASLTGQSFMGEDFFYYLLKKIMTLDGVSNPNPRDFFSQPGLYGVFFCILLAVALIFFLYCWALLLIYCLRHAFHFIKLRFVSHKQELPTQNIPEDKLFD